MGRLRLPHMEPSTSLSSWRAWIEIASSRWTKRASGRSPHGERGLKYAITMPPVSTPGRSPHGERGLKYARPRRAAAERRRSPHGERGLKFQQWP